MPWPKKDVPEEYLKLANSLISKHSVSKREFLDLCLLAIKYIDRGQTTLVGRSNMARYIANLWFRHDNINEDGLLDEIGGRFSELEIPGTFVIDDDLRRPRWEELKSWTIQADEELKTS